MPRREAEENFETKVRYLTKLWPRRYTTSRLAEVKGQTLDNTLS